MITGTSYFPTIRDARDYYADYESDPIRAVSCKLKAGEIHIGEPPLKSGERLLLIDHGRRYAIESPD